MLRQIQSDHANCYSSILLSLSGIFVKRNKVVVGSRNEGISNYMGEGVTCGIQFYFSVITRPKTHCLR